MATIFDSIADAFEKVIYLLGSGGKEPAQVRDISLLFSAGNRELKDLLPDFQTALLLLQLVHAKYFHLQLLQEL